MENTSIPIYSLDLTQLSKLDLDQINDLLKLYPYAHNLHALKILSSKAKNDVEFINLLNSEIMFIPDRSHLKKLTENLDKLNKQTINTETIINEDLAIEEILQPVSESEEITNAENEYEAILSDTVQVEEIIAPSEDFEHKNELTENQTITNNILDSQEFIEESELAKTSESMDDLEKFDLNKTKSFTLEEDDHDLSSFSLWLKNKTPKSDSEKNADSMESIILESKNEWEGLQEKILSTYQAGTLSKEEKHKKDTTDKKKKKLKTKIDETEVITESYALLLENQGKFNKAIKIYEKLSLIIPEKTTYFADKIEYLKNK